MQERLDQRRTIHERLEPPTYLTRLLGPRPEPDDPSTALWHVAAGAVERYRTEADITDPNSALGPIPDAEHLRLLRTHTVATLRDAHQQLRETRGVARSVGPDLVL